MYFSKFPEIFYTFVVNGEQVFKPVTDITANVRFRKQVLENVLLFDEYDIKEGETPEIIASKYYGSPEYHWIIMLVNQMYDWCEDWPMTQVILEQYIYNKYGTIEVANQTHHWVNTDGYIVSSDTPGAYPVSNYQYEVDLNETKRRIKLINPQLLGSILNEFASLV